MNIRMELLELFGYGLLATFSLTFLACRAFEARTTTKKALIVSTITTSLVTFLCVGIVAPEKAFLVRVVLGATWAVLIADAIWVFLREDHDVATRARSITPRG